ncbi:MAG: glycosyltransferase family 2 protein [Chthoniobacteraceae bacterium]
MADTQFIGIMLVHNEDRFLRRAASNVLGFCDRILIADHRSDDATWDIAQDLVQEHAGRIEAHQIQDPRESSEMLQPFAGTPTWVLGVDGDEFYDVEGLARTRRKLEAGMWKEWWVVFGNVVNCVEIDETSRTARGYLAPPCRSMTKLYNFAAVTRLDPDSPQRLMGRNNVFAPGYHEGLRHEVYKQVSWEEASFRCLHACFLPRSSRQTGDPRGRENITEMRKHSPLIWLRRQWARAIGRSAESQWKMEKYSRGPLVTVDATPFLT